MSAAHFRPPIVGNAGEALDLSGNVLATANEYSIFAQDLDGKLLLQNAGARRLCDYKPDAVACKDDWAILPPRGCRGSKPRVILDAAHWDGKWEETVTRIHKW